MPWPLKQLGRLVDQALRTDNSKKIGKLSYHPTDKIGKGGFGTVYRGLYSSKRPVAIKILERIHDEDQFATQQREVELMKTAGDHPNILGYIHHEMNRDNLFIATELCRGTLQEYVEGKYNGPKFRSERQILFQIPQGLAHLHGLGIVHRDINPNNILIYVPLSSDNRSYAKSEPQIKLADFGCSKIIGVDFTNTNTSNPRGTRGWIAPELYENPRGDFKVDIFALGLIFGYTLSGGKHPFGDDRDQWAFLIKNKESMKMIRNDLKEPYSSENNEAFDLIQSMLDMKPDKRPTVKEITNSLFFLENRQKWFERIIVSVEELSVDDNIVRLIKLLTDDDSINVNVMLESGYTPLSILCQNYGKDKLIYLVQLLVKKGADFKAKNIHGLTPLHLLCWKYENDNLLDIVQLLIKNGAEVDALNKKEWTPLHFLCRYYANDSLIDMVQLLIENGAEVNTKKTNGWTPLHFLCRYYEKDNLIDIVQLLIENGAEVNTKITNGWTSLHFLCRHYKNDNLIDIVQLLIKNGAEVNTKKTNGSTALHWLCCFYKNDNLIDIVQLLIENGAEVNTKTTHGRTPLHVLCSSYNNDNLIDIVQLFIENGAKVNTKLTDGLTPLHCLCWKYKNDNLIDIVQLLIKNGAEVDALNKKEWTPLHFLCRYYANDSLIDMVQLLIENGAEVNTKKTNGWTPLHFLCRYYEKDNLIDIVQLLIENGAEVNTKITNGWTSLHFLCRHYKNDNLIDIVQLLIENGAEVNTKTTHGRTPLHVLCSSYNNDNLIDIVQLFIENGAKVNTKLTDGRTPLHLLFQINEYAIKGGDKNLKRLVSLFEKTGASMNSKDIEGMTPNDHLIGRKMTALAADHPEIKTGQSENREGLSTQKNSRTPRNFMQKFSIRAIQKFSKIQKIQEKFENSRTP